MAEHERSHGWGTSAARQFLTWGLVQFALWIALLAFQVWRISELAATGQLPPMARGDGAYVFWVFGVAFLAAFVGTAIAFLRPLYRARRLLIEQGKLQFPSWFETVVSFGIPIANFFVPWNRIDAIRHALHGYAENGHFDATTPLELKARNLGILWGISSIIQVSGEVNDVGWMTFILAIQMALLAFNIWIFALAVRWFSDFTRDYEKAGLAAT